jgi:hypothetical protein
MDEEDNSQEQMSSSPVPSATPVMTLQKAVELGEYDPKFLSGFPEWHTFSKHVKFQFIQQAISNRFKQLDMQYASIINVLDFSKKPHLKQSLKNIEEQIQELRKDKEDLLEEYSQP